MPWPKGVSRPDHMRRMHEQNRGSKRTEEQRRRIGEGLRAAYKANPSFAIDRGRAFRKPRGNGGEIWVGDRRVQEHRYVAEQMLGRSLTSAELVHHLDGDKTNNAPENLLVLTRREHHIVHQAELLVKWCLKTWPKTLVGFARLVKEWQ